MTENANTPDSPDTQEAAENPFEQLFLFFADPYHAINAGRTVRELGFSAHIFQSRDRLIRAIREKALVAGVLLQGADDALLDEVRSHYKGPVCSMRGNKDALLEDLRGHVQTILRNHMRIDNLAVVMALRGINRFLGGTGTTLLLTGTADSLALAREYIDLFAKHPPVEIEEYDFPEKLQAGQAYITPGLLHQPVEKQNVWWTTFADAKARSRNKPHLITHEGSAESVDERYDAGKIYEALYEKLILSMVDTSELAAFSFEELCVQPPQLGEPRLVFEEVSEETEASVKANRDEDSDGPEIAGKKSQKKGFFSKLFGSR